MYNILDINILMFNKQQYNMIAKGFHISSDQSINQKIKHKIIHLHEQ